jgi:hypothetical protein
VPVAVVENVAVSPGPTVLLEGWVIIVGSAMLDEGADTPPPPQPRVRARIKDRNTTANACKSMIIRTLFPGSG